MVALLEVKCPIRIAEVSEQGRIVPCVIAVRPLGIIVKRCRVIDSQMLRDDRETRIKRMQGCVRRAAWSEQNASSIGIAIFEMRVRAKGAPLQRVIRSDRGLDLRGRRGKARQAETGGGA